MTDLTTDRTQGAPKHAVRRHLSGRYHTGFISVSAIVDRHETERLDNPETPRRRIKPNPSSALTDTS